jgi:hypothetical protein
VRRACKRVCSRPPLTSCRQSKSVTITASGRTADSPHPASPVRLTVAVLRAPVHFRSPSFPPIAPSKPRHLHEQQQPTWSASARAYSAALITALRDECERERRACSDSLRRVTELEAQLARREAELEERYNTTPTPTAHSPLPRLSRDGAIRILQQSAARNQALTHEIADLVHRVTQTLSASQCGETDSHHPARLQLEDAQAELEQSPSSSPILMTPPRRRASSPMSPTPKRHPSPPLPLHSTKDSSPTSSLRRFQGSPSPPLLSPRVPSPPTDIARQIAAVTQDLADLRAEERHLLRTRAQPHAVSSQQWVRYITAALMAAGILVPR